MQYPWASVFKCLRAQVTDSSLSGKTTKAYIIPAESGFFLDGIVHAPLFCGRITVVELLSLPVYWALLQDSSWGEELWETAS